MPPDPIEFIEHIDPLVAITGLGVAAVVIGAILLLRWHRRRRARATLAAAISRCGFECMEEVLIPDGQGGSVHIDFLLLTPRGIIVIDLRDVAGNIFGGDQMSEWTVMQRSQRYTFINPQTGLYDRVAAVRALAGEVPVEGRIVFTVRGRFPKGLPRHTLMLESLQTEFPSSDRYAMASLLARWMPAWETIRSTATPSKIGEPKSAI
jgi:hypothetical protein